MKRNHWVEKEERQPLQEPIMKTRPQGEIISPFGPPVWVGKLDEDIINDVNDIIESRRGDPKSKIGADLLAGRVEEQLTIEDVVSDTTKNHILDHAVTWAQSIGMEIYTEQLQIEGLWVNLQKEFEYNPIHAHDGMFSFVFYTKNTITREDATDNMFDRNITSESKALAGHIDLHYGETQFMNWTSMHHYPEKGDILIFPSWLNHSVYPFHDPQGERISVAGNIHYAQT